MGGSRFGSGMQVLASGASFSPYGQPQTATRPDSVGVELAYFTKVGSIILDTVAGIVSGALLLPLDEEAGALVALAGAAGVVEEIIVCDDDTTIGTAKQNF